MKKKGLIVATIVMVLVLAVSLTTATYAWFSSQAVATIENLAISTNAASGVQIAVYEGTGDTTTYQNGVIDYYEILQDGKHWIGNADGFGMLLDFADIQIGTMVNAVTNAATEEDFVYTVASVNAGEELTKDKYYTISNDGKPTVASGKALEDVTYYTREKCTTGNFYRPTGYGANIQPLGYVAVNPNSKDDAGTWTSYYEIPLAMQTVKETNAIVCSIAIKNKAESDSNLYPGMAAATRIRITAVSVEGEIVGKSYIFAPFSAYTYKNGTMTLDSTTNDLDSTGILNFVVADGTIKTTDVYKLLIEIWVEGTDSECHTGLTNVTNFDVDFGFDIYNADSFTGGGDLTITPEGGVETIYKFIEGLSQTISG